MLRKITIFPIICITENNDKKMLERVFIERMDSICQDLEIEYDKDLLEYRVNKTTTLAFLFFLLFLDMLFNLWLVEISVPHILMFFLSFIYLTIVIFKRSYKSWVEGQITDFPFCHPFLLWIINNNILIILLGIVFIIYFISWISSLTSLPMIVYSLFIFMTREKDSKKKESLNEIFIKDYILCDISDFKDYLLNNKKEDLSRWVENLSYSAKGILNIKEKGMDNDNVIKEYLCYLLRDKDKRSNELQEPKKWLNEHDYKLMNISLLNTMEKTTNPFGMAFNETFKSDGIMEIIMGIINDESNSYQETEKNFVIIDQENERIIVKNAKNPKEKEENNEEIILGAIFIVDTSGDVKEINKIDKESLGSLDLEKVKIITINTTDPLKIIAKIFDDVSNGNILRSRYLPLYDKDIKFLEDYIEYSVQKKKTILCFFIFWSIVLCLFYHLYGIVKLMTTIMKIETSFNDNNLNKQELAETIKTTLCNF